MIASLTTHLHAFVQEVQLTEDEFERAIEFIVAIGQATGEKKNEVVLAAEVFGLSTVVALMNNRAPDGGESPAALLGPFWRANAPRCDNGWFFAPAVSALPLVKDGKLKALAVGTAKRSGVLPDVPTTLEAGVPGSEFLFGVGMLAPARTPKPVIDQLQAEVAKVMASPELKERLDKLGAEPFPESAPALIHPMVLSELACGTPPAPRARTLRYLGLLRPAHEPSLAEVMEFVERERLYGLGCGLVDVAVLASALPTPGARLWTLGRRPANFAQRFTVTYRPG